MRIGNRNTPKRIAAGAGDDVIRLSIGLETADDLICGLDQALEGRAL